MPIPTVYNNLQLIGAAPGGPASGMASPGPVLYAVGATGFQYVTGVNGLTAHAGGGQANGVLITASVTRFTTVATLADSATLPATSIAGTEINNNILNGLCLELEIANAGANSMNIFPAVGEQINALGANAAFALAAGKTAYFTSTNSGQWHAVLSA